MKKTGDEGKGGMSLKMQAGFPDFHHKMSKKIAQLTKVIYHLNTKNDDHEYQLKTITDNYESEIQEVRAKLNCSIMLF